ncbi:MAG TPA: hypothetical protein ENF48_05125 [Desulfobacteraceae bacterium]|nr:hypothetical protein [Deltaproteobacteria bacterium]MBW2355185.1 hypothetical protein [Deltaproteobacteria bacterium]RLB93404.1 MAG: hypothetical protein DRH76_10225 [Deltaproteobacteria bacterium]HDI59729.1 hypothetical protein [Desulfobacteraceae bacterium]
MDSKKMAAVGAAVFEYIRSEEEALCASLAASGAGAPAPAIPPAARPWGLSGRQQQMELRNLMQWRAFAGARLR